MNVRRQRFFSAMDFAESTFRNRLASSRPSSWRGARAARADGRALVLVTAIAFSLNGRAGMTSLSDGGAETLSSAECGVVGKRRMENGERRMGNRGRQSEFPRFQVRSAECGMGEKSNSRGRHRLSAWSSISVSEPVLRLPSPPLPSARSRGFPPRDRARGRDHELVFETRSQPNSTARIVRAGGAGGLRLSPSAPKNSPIDC
jgi:hypothetical protein